MSGHNPPYLGARIEACAQMEFPANLNSLHDHEEHLRAEAIRCVAAMPNVLLHFEITETAMDMLDIYRQNSSEDEDVRALQALGCRVFNAFASATTLMLAGYYQPSAMLLRDILETVFLASYFGSEPSAVARWREVPAGKTVDEFKPVTIRTYLDKRDGFTTQKRAATYKEFSQLAGHPTAVSFVMLRPKDMEIRNGPFFDDTALEAVASEMGKLAVQIGEAFGQFLPNDLDRSLASKVHFATLKQRWLIAFGFLPASNAQD